MARKQGQTMARKLALAASMSVAVLSPPAAASNTVDPELRLAEVGYRLAAANASLCSQQDLITGLLLHDLSQYRRADRAGAARRFGLGDGIGVLDVVPGSAGDRAGLRARDEIVAVDGIAVPQAGPGERRSGSFDRMQAFLDALDARLRKASVTLDVRRGSARLPLVLTADRGCGGRFSLQASHVLNAWSDGGYVAVTTRLMAFADSDDELAFVVAHEMSHNILGHQALLKAQQSGLFPNDRKGTISVKATEIAADQFAIRLMADAGYDLAGAAAFLRKSRSVRWLDIPLDHPGIGQRLALVRSAAAQIGVAPPASAASPMPLAEAAVIPLRTPYLALAAPVPPMAPPAADIPLLAPFSTLAGSVTSITQPVIATGLTCVACTALVRAPTSDAAIPAIGAKRQAFPGATVAPTFWSTPIALTAVAAPPALSLPVISAAILSIESPLTAAIPPVPMASGRAE